MKKAATARDEALQEWQRACAAFDAQEPELPMRWNNWRETNAREARKRAATAADARALDTARKRYRALLCEKTQTRGEEE